MTPGCQHALPLSLSLLITFTCCSASALTHMQESLPGYLATLHSMWGCQCHSGNCLEYCHHRRWPCANTSKLLVLLYPKHVLARVDCHLPSIQSPSPCTLHGRKPTNSMASSAALAHSRINCIATRVRRTGIGRLSRMTTVQEGHTLDNDSRRCVSVARGWLQLQPNCQLFPVAAVAVVAKPLTFLSTRLILHIVS